MTPAYALFGTILLSLLGPVAGQGRQPAGLPGGRPQKVKLFKSEVDGLIRMLRAAQHENGTLGDGSAKQTAQALAAAGRCHRFYHAGDGPWVRRALQAVFRMRRADGGYGPPEVRVDTTRWVKEALQVMDPEGYAGDLREIATYLTKHGAADTTPLFALARARRAEAESFATAIATAKAEGGKLAGMLHGPKPPEPAQAIDALVALVAWQVIGRGEAEPEDHKPAVAKTGQWLPMQQKAFDFLLTQQENGVFFVQAGPDQRFPDAGMTALGLAAVQTKPKSKRSGAEQGLIDKGLAWLLEQQGEPGYFGRSNLNYTTCASVMALAAADDERYAEPLEKAQAFIVALQNADEKGYSPSDRDYGSIGYGGDERGDLSNLQFALEALTLTELDKDHEVFEKAKVFLRRTQNFKRANDFKSRTRDPDTGKWQNVESGNDGGAAYYPGNSPAGYQTLPNGTKIPRSYGSMTYSLLKAYTMCGLPKDDPRIVAAVGWITKHWTLEVNPGSDPTLPEKAKYQGLYYYYMVMAQALDTVGLDVLEVPSKKLGDAPAKVDWRKHVVTHLGEIQQKDGSWVNGQNGRWYENMPLICTAYSMLALQRCTR